MAAPRRVPGIDMADANLIITLEMKTSVILKVDPFSLTVAVLLISPLLWLCP